MKRNNEKNLTHQTLLQLRGCAKAILFLRLFIGGVMLLHVIGKMQTYDNLVLVYPSIMGFSSASTLTLSIIFQSLCAAMIMVGVATRFVALVMILMTLLSVVKSMEIEGVTISTLKVDFLYMGIYVTLLFSGSGVYGFNIPWLTGKNVPNS